MTQLDPKALAAANEVTNQRFASSPSGYRRTASEDIITAYLSALPAPVGAGGITFDRVPDDVLRMIEAADYRSIYGIHPMGHVAAEVIYSRDLIESLSARLETVTRERREAWFANERDRSRVADALNAITDEVARRSWLCNPGRGSYEWDDDRYRQEFSDALDAIGKATDTLKAVAGDWSHSPTTDAEIQAARTAIKEPS